MLIDIKESLWHFLETTTKHIMRKRCNVVLPACLPVCLPACLALCEIQMFQLELSTMFSTS